MATAGRKPKLTKEKYLESLDEFRLTNYTFNFI